jgi:hypothetical protein
MTSMEMVEFINASREPGEAELTHANLLKKVPLVLRGNEVNFYSVYRGGNGQSRPCYRFPKREACLMAMSYSYDLQAKVFDRMTELESRTTPAPVSILPQDLPSALRLYADNLEELAHPA